MKWNTVFVQAVLAVLLVSCGNGGGSGSGENGAPFGTISFKIDGVSYSFVRNNSGWVDYANEGNAMATGSNLTMGVYAHSKDNATPHFNLSLQFPGGTAGTWTLNDHTRPEQNTIPFITLDMDARHFEAEWDSLTDLQTLGASLTVTITEYDSVNSRIKGTFSGTLLEYGIGDGYYTMPDQNSARLDISEGCFDVGIQITGS